MAREYLDFDGLSEYDKKIKQHVEKVVPVVDSTLTNSGQAADAAVTGKIKEDLTETASVVSSHTDEIAYLLSKHFDSRDDYIRSMRMWFESQGADSMTPAELTALCDRWYASTRDNWNGWTTFYQPNVSDVSTGTRGGDNEGMVCVPSTDAVAGRDDFAAQPLFACVDVNFDIDPDSLDVVITAIDGVAGNFERSNPERLVGVMQMSGWVWTEEDAQNYTIGYSSRQVSGKDRCWPLSESIRPADNSMREFVVHTKYMGHWDGTKMTACAGHIPTGYMDMTTFLSRCKARGTGHGGCSALLQSFLIVMSYIKYASLTQDGINQGCVNYNYQYAAALGETATNRILITPAQAANLKVGCGVLIGAVGTSNHYDRDTASVYNISTNSGCVVTGIEEVEINGATYAAVITDHEGTFDTVGDGTLTTGNTVLSTFAWPSGINDNILGVDGAKENPGGGIYPAKIQGIEFLCGQYDTFGDALLYFHGADSEHEKKYYNVRAVRRAAQQTTSYTADYEELGLDLETPLSSNGWTYIRKVAFSDGIAFPAIVTGGSSSTYTRDAMYMNGSSTSAGVRVFRAFGSLTYGVVNAGLSCVVGVSLAYWLYAGRPSACANRGEWTA